ncbi:hypothetical protein A7985_24255 [Pseudoalteromonas luteoviolacea]|uniref:Uncharacterized protein n=1 Tax=Pseudoalteromonas luteoviolacea TaxID=43657 RepID=A0A1C0TJA8_9GAMM|nr:hypothetical protein [Pseudoalteromonas luteoviolacea]OCQ18325.1 hypothetical protein A7985_24255 [Pseudoalteromonas luteoviolacea]
MRFLTITLIGFFTAHFASAAATVSELNVQGETATFTLSSPKTHTPPSCVSESNQNKWAINLNSLQGQAMYSLLVTAVSKEQAISVESALRCESLADVEQVKSISLSMNSSAPPSEGAWLYKGDGITKLGKVISYNNFGYAYTPNNGTQTPLFYAPSIATSGAGLLYLDSECKTEPFLERHTYNYVVFYQQFNSYLTIANTSITENRMHDYGNAPVYKDWGGQTGCVKESALAYQFSTAYKLVKTEHDLCGKTPCWIK